jgi:hypothetical protein
LYKHYGSIKFNKSGGTDYFEYSLNGTDYTSGLPNGVWGGLDPGTYTPTIKDADGCTATVGTVELVRPAEFSVSVEPTAASACANDGTATVNVSGATPPYQYSLDNVHFTELNSFTGLEGDKWYQVWIKDEKGCEATTQFYIESNLSSPLTITNVSKTNPSVCNDDGQMVIDNSGGTSPYQYSLNNVDYFTSNMFTNLGAGTYTVYVKDANGCRASLDNIVLTKTEGVKTTYYADADGDGYGDNGKTAQACSAPAGYVSDNTDCDDTKASVHPGAAEVCNGIDDNCDGQIDEGVKTTYYADADGDGYGDNGNTTQACSAPPGYVSDNTDCDDTKASVHPGATEVCNGIDDNCDGQIDEGVKTTYYADTDGDGYGDVNNTTQACSAPTGYVSDNTDCDDTKASVHPGAAEVCNGIDDNCDGQIDEGVKTTYYRDADGDGYGDNSNTIQACSAPVGYVSNNTDCKDNDASIHPNAVEICGNGIDENCNGQIDENCTQIVRINDRAIAEGNYGTKNMSFTVYLNAPAAKYSSVRYSTANITAIARIDYVSKTGTVTFQAGEKSKTINITINGDVKVEPHETFSVNLSNPVNLIIEKTKGTGTIVNDDVPGIKISNVSKAEGNSGASTFSFTVTLDKPSYQTVKVNYATANGSAVSGSDYTSKSGTLTFNAGQTSKTIDVAVNGDTRPEGDETFKVVLGNALNGSIINGTGTGTIRNDDNVATRITAPVTTVWPNPASSVVNIKLTNPATSDISLLLFAVNGVKVKEWKVSTSVKLSAHQLDVSNLAQGVYMLVITDGKGNRQTEKVIIAR